MVEYGDVTQLFKLNNLGSVPMFPHVSPCFPEEHIRTDYGDEQQRLTPWQIYDEHRAQAALTLAEEALEIARRIVTPRLSSRS